MSILIQFDIKFSMGNGVRHILILSAGRALMMTIFGRKSLQITNPKFPDRKKVMISFASS